MNEIVMLERKPNVFVPPAGANQEPERRASDAGANLFYWVWFGVAFLAFAIPVKFC